MSKRGWVVFQDDDGNYQWLEQTFPIQTHASLVGWMQDFWSAFLDRPKFLRWIARLMMGKYAYRELYGSKEALEQYGFTIWQNYSLQNQEYHKDKIPT